MSTIPYRRAILVSATQRISTRFKDDIGNSLTGTGTGFWLISDRGFPYFVTNRHNVDPHLNRKLGENYRLCSASIAMRAYCTKTNQPGGDVHPLEIDLGLAQWYYPKDNSDVVVLRPSMLAQPGGDGLINAGIPVSFLKHPDPVEIMDSLFFVGFPGRTRTGAAYDMPIARPCTIASLPDIDYSIEDRTIPTSNTCLVAGLSFGGSSGSPVFMEKKAQLELLGIMTGHMQADIIGGDWAGQHSGLSYLTIGSVISNIFSENGL